MLSANDLTLNLDHKPAATATAAAAAAAPLSTPTKKSKAMVSASAPAAADGPTPSKIIGKLNLFDADSDWDAPENSKSTEKEEPLLVPNKRRFVLFPIQYNEVSNQTHIWRYCVVTLQRCFRPETFFWVMQDLILSTICL